MAEAVHVGGLRQFQRGLRDLDAALVSDLKAVGKDAAEEVATLARQLVPYQSGTLARTIRTGATARSATVKAGGRRAPYAGLIHFGGRNRGRRRYRSSLAPQPFLWNALDRRRDQVAAKFAEGVQAIVDRTDWT